MDWFKDEKAFKEASGYEIDGEWFPRVTKILSIKSKPALYRYYAEAKSYADAQAATEKSAAEGTLMHEVVQKIMVGESPHIPQEIAPGVNAAAQLLESQNVQIDPASVEKRIVNHPQRYAGTIDAMALIGGRLGVLDIKTSQAIYRDYNLQTSAYMDPLSKDHGKLSTRWIFRIDQQQDCRRCGATRRTKGGREKIKLVRSGGARVKLPCPEDAHDWGSIRGIVELKEFPYWKDDYRAFLAAKHLWEWENDFWLRKIGYNNTLF